MRSDANFGMTTSSLSLHFLRKKGYHLWVGTQFYPSGVDLTFATLFGANAESECQIQNSTRIL